MPRSLHLCCAALLALPLPLLTGCGATPAVSTPPSANGATIDGRWSFITQPPLQPGTPSLVQATGVQFHGALTSKGEAIAGVGFFSVLQPLTQGATISKCIVPQPVQVHGTLNAARHLTLTSDPVDGSTLQIDVDVPSDPHNPAAGMVKVTGGSCPADAGSTQGNLWEPLQGSFAGPLVKLDSTVKQFLPAGTASAVLSETPSDSTGKSLVTGSVTVNLPTCSAQLSIQETRYGGVLYELSPQTTVLQPSALIAGLPSGIQLLFSASRLGADCKTEPLGAGTETQLQAAMSRQ